MFEHEKREESCQIERQSERAVKEENTEIMLNYDYLKTSFGMARSTVKTFNIHFHHFNLRFLLLLLAALFSSFLLLLLLRSLMRCLSCIHIFIIIFPGL